MLGRIFIIRPSILLTLSKKRGRRGIIMQVLVEPKERIFNLVNELNDLQLREIANYSHST